MSSFTSTIPNGATAKALIKSGKRNLLHNWDFRNPVNQRGQNAYTVGDAAQYCIDRWRLIYGTYNVATKTIVSSGQYGGINELIENPSLYAGKTLTYSMKLSISGVGAKLRFVVDGATYGEVDIAIGFNGIATTTVTLPSTISSSLLVQVYANTSGCTMVLDSTKLEFGTVSTLANDLPADYGEELRKCQRYCMAYNQFAQFIGVDFQPDVIDFTVQTPCNMRAMPGVLNSGNLALISNKTVQTGFTYSIAAASGNNIRLRATKTSHGLTSALIECSALVLLSADIL